MSNDPLKLEYPFRLKGDNFMGVKILFYASVVIILTITAWLWFCVSILGPCFNDPEEFKALDGYCQADHRCEKHNGYNSFEL